MAWNSFRYSGPFNARWDYHLPKEGGAPAERQRGIYYAGVDAKTCLAEFFQATRCIDRAFQAPWLVIFDTAAPLLVLDLTSDFVTRMGASMAIHSAPQRWPSMSALCRASFSRCIQRFIAGWAMTSCSIR